MLAQDVFGRAHKLVVLGPTGDVVLKETWEKVIKPEGEFKGGGAMEEWVLCSGVSELWMWFPGLSDWFCMLLRHQNTGEGCHRAQDRRHRVRGARWRPGRVREVSAQERCAKFSAVL